MRENALQLSIATGRLTLPVVIFICLLLWGCGCRSWSDLGSLSIVAVTAYLMIEGNTAFSLIRTRTTFPVSIYLYLTASLFFLHPFRWDNLVQPAVLCSLLHLYAGYEKPSEAAHPFHAFLFIGLGSLAFPPLLYAIPLGLVGMIQLRFFSFKNLVAALLGVAFPYWLLFGYAFLADRMSLFEAPFRELVHFRAIDYAHLTLNEVLAWGTVTLSLLVSGGHYLKVSYQDKTRTRSCLLFLVTTGGFATLAVLLQPQHLSVLIQIQLLCTAFLNAHLFTLTRNRFSGIYFILIFVLFIFLTLYNLWMQFFSF